MCALGEKGYLTWLAKDPLWCVDYRSGLSFTDLLPENISWKCLGKYVSLLKGESSVALSESC